MCDSRWATDSISGSAAGYRGVIVTRRARERRPPRAVLAPGRRARPTHRGEVPVGLMGSGTSREDPPRLAAHPSLTAGPAGRRRAHYAAEAVPR
eukprot:scaffold849_cov386-Prasinococcus_capsulatus_cf.AAC.3